ncbi:formylglycine-generating enzyme family protein [Polyangium fumosum]|uniref:formylglycine-generating enzyme family protein n=1 Tax=Polyangium fumosum TaxID=889272 RepID=UPI0014796DE3|nr:SUMF1/EgtB/PvdO family nonheme iron enzyme [Polyangium fumosum]
MALRVAALLFGAALHAGCARSEPTLGGPAPADGDAGEEQPLPGPLPGWEVPFDGITCRHPAVQADCRDGFCRIPAGCFIKGSPLEETGHPAKIENQRAVTLTHDFWVGQHEVTQEQWSARGLHDPSMAFPAQPGGDCTDDPRCPVGSVTWFEALAFANLLSKAHEPPLPACYELSGCSGEIGHGMTCASVSLTAPTIYDCTGYRLPTAAEYEYAVRAGTREAFYFGPSTTGIPTGASGCDLWPPLAEIAWYCANSGDFTHPVGQKRPNAWHLYDMVGNAREWVNDEAHGQAPPPGPLTDPGGQIVIYVDRQTRGGSAIGWPTLLRSASSLGSSWDFIVSTHGFRLARTLPHEASGSTGP